MAKKMAAKTDKTKSEDLSPMSIDTTTDTQQELTVEPIQPKLKQYLLLADELHMSILGKLMPGLLFVEVEGLPMKDSTEYMLLANPVQKPKE